MATRTKYAMAPVCGRLNDDDALRLTLAGISPRFSGPSPLSSALTAPLHHRDGVRDLIYRFCEARQQSMPTLPDWVHDKILRKAHWARAGVDDLFLVPTLLSSAVEWDGTRLEVPDIVEDGYGGWVPNLEAGTPVQTIVEPGCRERLHALLHEHRCLCAKPSRGSNSRGVLLLSVEDQPFQGVPDTDGAQQYLAASIAPSDGSEAEGDLVWMTNPFKGYGAHGAERLPYAQLWEEQVVQSRALCEGGSFLVEPSLPHDQELCALSINGGRLIVVAGRSVVMERILVLQGLQGLQGDGDGDSGGEIAPIVAPADFEVPADMPELCNPATFPASPEAERRRHTTQLLTQRVHGDAKQRTLLEAIVDVTRALAKAGAAGEENGEAAAFRADFFVRWAKGDGDGDGGVKGAGEGARLWLNEVEHGFNPGCTLGWFGPKLTALALRAWVLGGDPAQREAFLDGTADLEPLREAAQAQSAQGEQSEQGDQGELSFVCELAAARVAAAATEAAREAAATAAEGEAAWLLAFWAGTQQRKHGVRCERVGRSGVRVAGPPATPEERAAEFEERWGKQLFAALKKVEVDDLGPMEAPRLWEAIPEDDGAGRGRRDLAAMERELSVKVVFCEGSGRVLLVGARPKLAKKCFAMRNLLSHYHWRLSGRDVAFETMAAARG